MAASGINVAEFDAAAHAALNPPAVGASAEKVGQHQTGNRIIANFKASPDAWNTALNLFSQTSNVNSQFICLQVRAVDIMHCGK